MSTINTETGTINIPADHDASRTQIAAALKKTTPQARAKWKRLNNERALASHMRRALWDREEDLRGEESELRTHAAHLKETMEHGRATTIGPEDHERLADLESQIAEKVAERAKLRERASNIAGSFDTGPLGARLVQSGRRFKHYEPPVSVPKGKSVEVMLTDQRAHVNALKKARERIENAPLPLHDAIANARADIERKAKTGEIYWGRYRLTEAAPNGRYRTGSVHLPKSYDGGVERTDHDALFFAVHKDWLIAEAEKQLRELDDPDAAVALADRKLKAAEIDAEILTAERIEECLVMMLEANGATVGRRPDCHPMAVLQLEYDDSPPAVAKEAAPEPDESENPEAIKRAVKRARRRDPTVPAEEPNFG